MAMRTVLVVEDSKAEAEMLERGLRSALVRSAVVLVNTTTEAEAYLFSETDAAGSKASNPDLVMLDVKIPPEGGVELLRKLRSNAKTQSIPVVMMSGQLRDQDVQYLYQSGANSYLDKPVDFQEFISLI